MTQMGPGNWFNTSCIINEFEKVKESTFPVELSFHNNYENLTPQGKCKQVPASGLSTTFQVAGKNF